MVVAPYMNKLTKSELHAVMTGGFATVAGSYMAVLIQVGVSTRAFDGGSPCRLSIINANVACFCRLFMAILHFKFNK